LRRPRLALFPYTTLFRSIKSRFGRLDTLVRTSLVLRLKIELTNSPPRRGGVARQLNRSCRAGVVSSAKSRKCRSDHPVCAASVRSEEHTSELRSRFDLVC